MNSGAQPTTVGSGHQLWGRPGSPTHSHSADPTGRAWEGRGGSAQEAWGPLSGPGLCPVPRALGRGAENKGCLMHRMGDNEMQAWTRLWQPPCRPSTRANGTKVRAPGAAPAFPLPGWTWASASGLLGALPCSSSLPLSIHIDLNAPIVATAVALRASAIPTPVLQAPHCGAGSFFLFASSALVVQFLVPLPILGRCCL